MAVVALMLSLAGFIVGVILAGDDGQLLASREQQVGDAAPEETPRAQSPSIPREDVTGSDISGLSRYPGSVRIEYIREDQGSMIWTETEYLTDAGLSQVREFYRDSFRSEDWSVNDVGFAQNAWVFFIVKDEREVFVEIRPRGDIVEVDIEQTEPKEEAPERNTGGGNGNRDNADDQPSQQSQPEPAPEPPPEPAPAAPAPAAAPANDDGYDDNDDDYYDDYDDGYEEYED
ncbi:MAG: hypothetical protein ACR2N0_04765 [Rubrobacteraceae bacterium]|nr:hypothetical protein [Rubrobacter sp.]